MSKTFLINSTLAPGKIYFRGTADYLNGKGFKTEIILPRSVEFNVYSGYRFYENIEMNAVLPKDWKLEEYENFVSDKVNGEKCSIIGHSYAGNVAFNVAEKNSGNVDKLVMIDSIPEWKCQPLEFRIIANFLGRLPDSWKEKVGGNKSVIEFMLNGMIDSDMDEKMFNNLVETAEISGGKWNIKALYNGKKYSSENGFIRRMEELSQKTDIHFIYASEDAGDYVKKHNIGDILGSENMHEIENSGHLISLERPDKFNQTLEKILN